MCQSLSSGSILTKCWPTSPSCTEYTTIFCCCCYCCSKTLSISWCASMFIGHLRHVIWFAPGRSYTQSYKIRLPTGQPFSEFVSILFFFFKCKMLVLLYLFIHFFFKDAFLPPLGFVNDGLFCYAMHKQLRNRRFRYSAISAFFFVVFFAVSLCACEDVTWSIKVVSLDAYLQ